MAANRSSVPPLADVRGLLLDLDGVLVLRNRLILGAREAIDRLDEAAFPYVVATNMSLVSRETLSAELIRGGLQIPPGRLLTAASAAAAHAARTFPGQPLYVLAAPDALREFQDQRLITYEEAADPSVTAAAVIVGDAGEQFSAANMQSAFRMLREGAAFIAMHKNRWWLTPQGVLLDSGAYVTALEFGVERKALVTGKPSRAFFREGIRRLGELAGERLSAHEVAMVGDDLWNDIRGAQRAGVRGVFVRSGKHGDAELGRLAAEGGAADRVPDGIAADLADVVDACLAVDRAQPSRARP